MPPALLGAGAVVGWVLWVLARQYDEQDSVESVARKDPRYQGKNVSVQLGKIARRLRRKIFEYGRQGKPFNK